MSETAKPSRMVLFNMIAESAQKDLKRYTEILPFLEELAEWGPESNQPDAKSFAFKTFYDVRNAQLRIVAWYKSPQQNQNTPCLLIGANTAAEGFWALPGWTNHMMQDEPAITAAGQQLGNHNQPPVNNVSTSVQARDAVMTFTRGNMFGHARFKEALNTALSGTVAPPRRLPGPGLI